MKKILGLDLGTNSIGWALVNESEKENEKSSIIKLGVRTVHYDNFVNTNTGKECMDAEKDFCGGKGISCNAGRTKDRGMRRNLQRYKLRRDNLIEVLKENGFISDDSILSENGNATTFQTYRLRAKAATEEISLEEFARVLLMINKKRGYKSSRKAKSNDEGQLIDGMDVAKYLYDNNLTPGQYALTILEKGKKFIPDFYRSDLQLEFDRIWNFQKTFYPSILTDELKDELKNKNEKQTWAICAKPFNLVGIKRETKGEELKKENFEWRAKALSEKMNLEQLAIVLQKVNSQLKNSSGYLGAISDRSKELYFDKQTVGQYQMAELDKNPNYSLRNQVFYRQDYLDEFEQLWETQAKYHKELTPELKKEIRDVVIFYQRQLKSQKGLISFCEFENKQIEVEIDGKKKLITIGSRVCPKSSPLFQEFKIWQVLNNIEIFPANEKNKKYRPNARSLDKEEKNVLFSELSYKEELNKNQILELLDLSEYEMNYEKVSGNKTQYELLKAYKSIIELSGHECEKIKKVEDVEKVFDALGINTNILHFDSSKAIERQEMFKLWHLLYSFEGDKTKTGNEKLIAKLEQYGLEKEFATILANVKFKSDYGSLCSKAIKKILPHLKDGEQYDVACVLAGYGKHSKSSLKREEIDNKVLKDHLDILPKNSLRNPIVEKILNQMINVINEIIDSYGKPDEIRIELARELKKNANERFMLSTNIDESTQEIRKLKSEIKEKFPIFQNQEPSRNDILRYRLWKELASNAYKPLYGSKENIKREISPAILFSNKIEIEHILPQARLFDDSFSNKTLVYSSDNKDKGNRTAFDYVGENGREEYINRIIAVYGTKKTQKVIVNPTTKKKSIKIESFSFKDLYKKHENAIIKSSKYKGQIDKWEKANEVERKKIAKPWGKMTDVEKKVEIINKYFSGKLKKLIISVNELPEGFINRDLSNTQYITKEAKNLLGDLVKYVGCTTGSITDRLREDWQLVDIMRELNWDKYKAKGLTEESEKEDYDGNKYIVKKIKDWTKRNDHRHHAMDALTVAFTKRSIVQYLNNLNARRFDDNQNISNKENETVNNTAITSDDIILNTRDVLAIEQNELYRDKHSKLRFKMPFENFRSESKKQLERILISIKSKNKVSTQNINITKKKSGTYKKVQLTPRGQLHNETIYGSIKQYVAKIEKVGANFNAEKIATVASPKYKELLLGRLAEFGNDAKKAFTGKNSLDKNPIFVNEAHTEKIPEKIKTVCFETLYTIRKDISPDLKLDKIVDDNIRRILQKRLDEFGGDAKKAFSNLDENPIWLNKEKGIAIKRVTIKGVSNATALHDKHDQNGKLILDENGKPQPTDYVSTSNNHHVAIYRDANDNLQENVVSFFEATTRVNLGLPIIDKEYKKDEGWQFLFTMKQNEYFVFPNKETGFDPKDIDLTDPKNYSLISPNLFRVQKFTIKDYFFRQHLETTVDDNSKLKGITWKRCSLAGIDGIIKVRINHIGQIVSVGEY